MHLARTMLVAGIFAALAGPIPAQAQDTQEQSIAQEPPNSPEGIPRPTRGMTMEQVRKQFGEPDTVEPAVGDPPITRWVYGKYTVYFEYQYVLHSVVHKQDR
jgi:hypothetical protein